MSEQKKPEPLDQLLDSLLSGYSDVEPRPGMQTRLLAHLRDEATSSHGTLAWPWRQLLATGGVVTLAAVMVAIYISKIPPVAAPPRIEAAGRPMLPPTPSSQEPVRHWRKRLEPQKSVPSVSVANVRQEVFPARSPLSEQERLFFRYLAETPPEEVAAHSHSDEPAQPSVPLGPQSQQLNETEIQGTR